LLNYVIDRLKEPSTMSGIAAALSAIPQLLADPSNAQAWGVVIAALMAVVLKERAG